MSQRMTMDEVLKEYGVPQIKLDIHATRSACRRLSWIFMPPAASC